MKTIKIQALRDQVYLQVLQGLVTGVFAAGAKIRDTEVAERLGVSRTPVREALLRLAQEGFLDNQVGRGFSVCTMSVTELQEVYPIVWTLETMALRATPLPTPELEEELRQLNARIGADDQDGPVRLELDFVWHQKLVQGCGNRSLLELIARLKKILQRYLHAYIMVNPRIQKTIRDHDTIVNLLAAGDVDRAAAELEKHYRRNLEIVVQVFESKG